MAEAEKGILFNGVTISVDELHKKMAELKALQGLQKEAKKAGLIVKAKVAPRDKSANFNLVLAQFAPVVESNAKIIAGLFIEYEGQDSISFDVNKDYHVIIRSKAVVKAKQEKRAADAKVAKEAAEGDTLKETE